MTTGAYILARLSDPESLSVVSPALDHSPAVSRWNAVQGHAHLVLRVNAPAEKLPTEIAKMPGLSDLKAFDILPSGSGDDLSASFDQQLSYSYLFIEATPHRSDILGQALRGMNSIIFCMRVTGGWDLVACVQGKNFSDIGTIINDTIRPLDGILRMREERIIHLSTMS